MSLTKRINEQLQKATADQAVVVEASEEKLRVEVKLADSSRLGCLLDRLHLEHTEGGQLPIDPAQVVAQITYLGERLEIIETEGKEGMTILRSTPPRGDGEVISFYEMVVDRSTRLSLIRYKYDPETEERTPMPAPLTRDTLERLVGDLIQLAGGK
ncbi:MAG: hypothetical protein PVJ69_10295 [Desulfobacteraceae bacterium]|jgi:hypothetical protein